MSALATRAAPVFNSSAGERPFLKRQRGAACRDRSREKFAASRAVATERSAPPAPKRACRGFDVKIGEERFAAGVKDPIVRASASERLKQRMDAERGTLGILCKRAARLLSGDAGRSGKHDARKSTSSAEVAARVKKSTPSKPASEMGRQSTEPKKPQPAVQRAAAGTTSTEISMSSRIDQAKEAIEKRRQAEIARAREKFRLELLEVAKAAMPDETIYPEDLKELGIRYQYAVTRTRKQAERMMYSSRIVRVD